jgi:hypothetical protein
MYAFFGNGKFNGKPITGEDIRTLMAFFIHLESSVS